MIQQAKAGAADVIVFPELSLPGYLVAHPAQWIDAYGHQSIEMIRAELGPMTAMVGGPPARTWRGNPERVARYHGGRCGCIARQDPSPQLRWL